MGFKVRLFFLSSALIVALAYYTRPIFPDTANNPVLKTVVGLIFQTIFLIAKVGNDLGVASWLNMTRMIFDVMTVLDDGGSGNILQEAKQIEGIDVLVFRPQSEITSKRPGIIYYHGGGWVVMAPSKGYTIISVTSLGPLIKENYAAVTREIAEQTQSVVISIDYRLAPEHLFPAAFDDCLKVTKAILRNAEGFGVDPNKIAIMGDSAGGNLAMAVTLALAKERDSILPRIKLQSLIYPALQAFDFNLPAYITHADGPGIIRKNSMITYWLLYAFGNSSFYNAFTTNSHISDELRQSKYASYVDIDMLPKEIKDSVRGKQIYTKGNSSLSDAIQNIVLDSRYAPLMAPDKDLALLPPTYILIAEFDVLRDDGFLAVERLRKVGVPVERNYLPGEEHGLLNLIGVDGNSKAEIVKFAAFFNKTIS